jgi:uncharacterized protein
MFGHKKEQKHQVVTDGRFELERGGHVAYLQYSLGGGVLELIHSEVPPELRGQGMAAKLAKSALDYARENNLKVDIVCPSVADFVAKHPEYADLILE